MAAPAQPLYDGSDGGRIDLATASQWALNYRNDHPGETRSHYFGRQVLDQILAQSDCKGIRIYYAKNDNNEKELLVVGVDGAGRSMFPVSSGIAPGDYSIMDISFPCPPICPPGSDL